MRPSTVVGLPSRPSRQTLTASWNCPDVTRAWPRVTKSLCDTCVNGTANGGKWPVYGGPRRNLALILQVLHRRFGGRRSLAGFDESRHLGTAQAGLVDHEPGLAVLLPGLDR